MKQILLLYLCFGILTIAHAQTYDSVLIGRMNCNIPNPDPDNHIWGWWFAVDSNGVAAPTLEFPMTRLSVKEQRVIKCALTPGCITWPSNEKYGTYATFQTPTVAIVYYYRGKVVRQLIITPRLAQIEEIDDRFHIRDFDLVEPEFKGILRIISNHIVECRPSD